MPAARARAAGSRPCWRSRPSRPWPSSAIRRSTARPTARRPARCACSAPRRWTSRSRASMAESSLRLRRRSPSSRARSRVRPSSSRHPSRSSPPPRCPRARRSRCPRARIPSCSRARPRRRPRPRCARRSSSSSPCTRSRRSRTPSCRRRRHRSSTCSRSSPLRRRLRLLRRSRPPSLPAPKCWLDGKPAPWSALVASSASTSSAPLRSLAKSAPWLRPRRP